MCYREGRFHDDLLKSTSGECCFAIALLHFDFDNTIQVNLGKNRSQKLDAGRVCRV